MLFNNKKKQEEAQKLYNSVVGAVPIAKRLDQGNCSKVEIEETGWLVKTSYNFVDGQRELETYKLLKEFKLCGLCVPHFKKESTKYKLHLQRINDTATLSEYVTSEHLTKDVWFDICKALAKTLRTFHMAGFCHNDLHSDNVVLEYNATKWRCYLIDFAHTTHWSKDNLSCDSFEEWTKEAYVTDSKYIASYVEGLRWLFNCEEWFTKATKLLKD